MVHKSEAVNALEFNINKKTRKIVIAILVNIFYNVLPSSSAYCLESAYRIHL